MAGDGVPRFELKHRRCPLAANVAGAARASRFERAAGYSDGSSGDTGVLELQSGITTLIVLTAPQFAVVEYVVILDGGAGPLDHCDVGISLHHAADT